ncbi:Uma2 family endonuclease [Thermus scotoductus]|uniref:Uma2 family endonuclease n=1 Tax=Thermus scotoductus TaxID=37636 RepID=UPI0005718E7E|nr:Uma2 family endonuclease [Thermus scotoductus]
MGTAPKLLSLEAYLEREARSRRKHEFVEGVAYALAGANARHNLLVSNLLYLLRRGAEGKPCRVFPSDMRLKVGNRVYYPDLTVVCHPVDLEALYLEDACLVVEVLSPKTASIDAREKRTAYLGLPGLRGYLMVDSRRPSLTLYRKTPEGLVEERGRLWLPCLDLELDPEEVYRL